MLHALLAAGIEPDRVVGSSVGAVDGAYLAGGPNLEGVGRLAAIWQGIRRSDVFPATAGRGVLALLGRAPSLLSPAPLRRLLERHLPMRRLEDAAVPCHVVATIQSFEISEVERGRSAVAARAGAAAADSQDLLQHSL